MGTAEIGRSAAAKWVSLRLARAVLLAAAGVPVAPYSGDSRDFLLCRYPQVSVFDKSKANVPGAAYDAHNWSCRASRD